MKLVAVIVITVASLLTACGTIALTRQAARPGAAQSAVVTLSATGYGAINNASCEGQCERTSTAQRKLLAMRASRLDAYRAMAEQVYGLRIEGGSTVAALVLKDDGFKVYIDAFIRGARVTNVTQREDGSFETTVEMEFDPTAAPITVPAAHPAPGTVKTPRTMLGSAGPGAAYGASFYHAQ